MAAMFAEEGPVKKPASPLYLGFDFSTQQLKVVCIDDLLSITYESCVVFDKKLPEFSTVDGVRKDPDGLTVTAPPLMWIKAVDVLLEKMKMEGFPFACVVSLSGCGQQHGSVFWKEGSESVLRSLSKESTLADQLKDCFSVVQSPVWMDSSTREQCIALEGKCGGAQALANRTGSRAYERFTGNQIAKIFQQQRSAYNCTERISLVSSFAASLFLGSYSNIDYSDGSGMNLLDIATRDWWPTALDACADNLRDKLGKPVCSNTVLGKISSYFVGRYGFHDDCKVVAFTGDNPSSLAGMRLEEGDVVVSLGSSDTLSIWINEAHPQLMGHVFVNPVNEEAYMAMLCYKNGSITREKIRDDCGLSSWKEFDELLDETPPGNNGNIGMYFQDPEITPPVHGCRRIDKNGVEQTKFSNKVEIRCLVEGQCLAKLSHTTKLGFKIGKSTTTTRVLATGGAAQNYKILQIIADVFNSKVYILEGTANASCVGGAYRAKHSLEDKGTNFSDVVKLAPPYKLAVTPQEKTHKVYLSMLERYEQYEEELSK